MWKYLLLVLVLIPSAIANNNKKQIRIAVIDTGLDMNDVRFRFHLCEDGHRDFTGEGLKDTLNHGTHVAGSIVKYAKNADYCLIIIKPFYKDNRVNNSEYYSSLLQAKKYKATIINISGGGPSYFEEERLFIKFNPTILFVVAVGNENQDINVHPFYPASYHEKNIIRVGATDKNGVKIESSNYGNNVVWELGDKVFSTLPNGAYGYMTGSSMATSIVTGKIIKRLYDLQHN